MPPANHPGRLAEFWRCGNCGTPNPWASYLTQCVGCGAGRPAKRPTANPDSAPIPRTDRRSGRALFGVSAAYLAVVFAALVLIKIYGESGWPFALLLFAPRVVFLLPLPLLAWLAWRRRQRRLWALHALIAWIVVGPLMGFNVPTGRLVGGTPSGTTVRLLTLNIGARGLDVDRFIQLVDREKIDVICFQEWPGDPKRADPRLDAYLSRGWYRDRARRIASRWPIVREYEPSTDAFPEYQFWPLRLSRVRLRSNSGREFVVASAHLPTMRTGFRFAASGNASAARRYLAWRREQATELLVKLADVGDEPLLVAGDFNMPADSPMLDPLRLAFRDAHEEAGWGFGYTCPTPLPWGRIDQVYGSDAWRFRRSRVASGLGSDHLPVIVEAVLEPSRP